jgi:hypothetical protein
MKKDNKQKLFENMSKLNPDFNLNEGKNYDKSRLRMISVIEKELNVIREEARTDDTVFWYQTLLYSVLDKLRNETFRG